MAGENVKSAVRVLEILEYFARYRRPSRLRDVVQYLGYPTSSVNALLKSMAAQGYMHFDLDTHCYIPTARVAQLANWITIGGFEQTVVLDAMYRLRAVSGEPVVLATPSDIYLEYVESLHGSEGVNSYIKRGVRRLMTQTGTGLLFLSRQPLDEALGIWRRTIEAGELTEREFPKSTFLERLDAHRAIDVSYIRAKDVLRPTAHWGAAMISMIIPEPPGHRALALGAHGPAERLEKKFDLIAVELRALGKSIGEKIEQPAP